MIKLRVSLVLLLLLCNFHLLAQKSYRINTNDGLSNNNLTVIIKDRNNYMWMGSYDGVQKHEGSRVKVYKRSAIDSLSLSSNEAHTLFEDKEGFIWVGTMAGVDRIDPKTDVVRHYSLKSYFAHESNGYPYAIFQDKKDSIWVTNDGGLFRLDAKTGGYNQVEERNTNGKGVYNSCTGYKGSFATESGTWLYTIGGMVFYEYSTGKFHSKYFNPEKKRIFNIEAGSKVGANGEMCNDKKGNLYFIASDSILIKYNIETERTDSFPFTRPPLSWQCCYALSCDYQDNIWIGFRMGGILLFNQIQSTFTPIRFEGVNSLIGSNYIYSFAEDYLHRMWVTTNNGAYIIDLNTSGINQFYLSYKREFTDLQYNTGMLTEDGSGNLYLPFNEGGLIVFSQGTGKTTQYPSTKIHTSYNLLYPDYLNKKWIASDKHLNAVNVLKGKLKIDTKQDLLTTLSITPKGKVTWMLKAKHELFVAVDRSIFAIQDKKTAKQLFTRGLRKQMCLSADSQYLYYVNRGMDISRLNTVSQKEDTLSITSLLQKIGFNYDDPRDLADDGRGNIWIASRHGLIRYHVADHLIETYTTAKGLSNNFSFAICVDRDRNLWVATLDGISRYNVANNTFNIFHYLSYSTYQDSFGSGLLLKNGNVAFHIGNRLIIIDPAVIKMQRTFQKQLRINEIAVNDKPIEVSVKSLSLTYTQNRIMVKFGLLDFENASKATYYYNLNSLDSSWISLGNHAELFFYSLSPGTYNLKVKAVDGLGNPVSDKIKWSPYIKTLSVIIEPPFWQTGWFITVGFLAAGTFIYYLIRSEISSVRKEEQQKSRFEREASELKAQALRAQMNPHFIFNCLNSIKALIQENHNQQAVIYLTTFSKLIRNQLNNAQAEISLSEELETCKLYTQLEALRFGSRIACEFTVEEGVDIWSVKVPPLILQPFVENAIWHGILPKEGGKVTVSVTRAEDGTRCMIDDNGIGRNKSILNKSQASSAYESKGMKLVQNRLNLYNTLQNRGGSIEVIDKKDGYGYPAGTQVIVTFNKEV